jgi:hypothetical protein
MKQKKKGSSNIKGFVFYVFYCTIYFAVIIKSNFEVCIMTDKLALYSFSIPCYIFC